MLFHFDFVAGQRIYNLHSDVLAFFRIAIRRRTFTLTLFSPQLQNIINDSNDLSEKFQNVFIELNCAGIDKRHVYNWLLNNNNVIRLLTDVNYQLMTLTSPQYDELYRRIKELYLFLWSSTIKTQACNINYSNIKDHYIEHDRLNSRTRRICPFCGLKKLENPIEKRNEYDHYFDKDTFPYMAINFFNLVPMCDSCNKRPNKGTRNIIMNSAGNRGKSYYPYQPVQTFNVGLQCDNLFLPNENWIVSTTSVQQDIGFAIWKDIFRIDFRYKNYITSEYNFWILSFGNYFRNDLPDDIQGFKDRIRTYINDILDALAVDVGSFLQLSFWQFFINLPAADLNLLVDFLRARNLYAA